MQNEGSFCTKDAGDVFLRKSCAFVRSARSEQGRGLRIALRRARQAKPVDTIPHEGEASPSYISFYKTILCQRSGAALFSAALFLRRRPFGEGGGHRPPFGHVRGRRETEDAVRRRKRALPAPCPAATRHPAACAGVRNGGCGSEKEAGTARRPPRRVENGSVPFRVLRMPEGGGMIGAGGVKRAGEDETHVHSICAERRRDADRL